MRFFLLAVCILLSNTIFGQTRWGQVAPIFTAHNCPACHGGTGGIFLNSLSATLASMGDNQGQTVIPGNAAASPLFDRIQLIPPSGGENMPRGAGFLTVQEIATIEQWINDGALPVELTDFTAEEKSGLVDLLWSTATETNNDYFSVEHSTDGKFFKEIAKIKGSGNSLERVQYEYNDEKAATGINYYRLKQVDFDGTFDYSDILVVKIQRPFSNISIAPNPIKNTTDIRLVSDVVGDVTISVYNTLGQEVYRTIQSVELGESNIRLDATAWTRGLYFIRIHKEDYITSLRLIKE